MATPTESSGGMLAWHVHHADKLFEELYEGGIEERSEYIRLRKPQHEIETRLRLLKPVKDQARLRSIQKAYDEALASAQKACDEALASAGKAYDEAVAPARKAYDEAVAPAWKAYDEAVDELHREECPNCPWDGKTKTIFPFWEAKA